MPCCQNQDILNCAAWWPQRNNVKLHFACSVLPYNSWTWTHISLGLWRSSNKLRLRRRGLIRKLLSTRYQNEAKDTQTRPRPRWLPRNPSKMVRHFCFDHGIFDGLEDWCLVECIKHLTGIRFPDLHLSCLAFAYVMNGFFVAALRPWHSDFSVTPPISYQTYFYNRKIGPVGQSPTTQNIKWVPPWLPWSECPCWLPLHLKGQNVT